MPEVLRGDLPRESACEAGQGIALRPGLPFFMPGMTTHARILQNWLAD
ncbi:hypothetical protein JL2886_00732 [Phaeobacter gallaeciensis]|uniref:Uncharacterized protein n=1 Tax=Phaeobacter gallaeciensis TaxID=60890 RepID=A0A1B0ZNH2_9RHOB|nr:hypothetical protein JL2886_00732 [Phaeobacter gallaeciensis]